MNDKEINIAIAEACPDKFRYEHGLWFFQYATNCWSQCHNNSICADLNAMQEAEKTCLTTIPLVTDYGIRLVNILHGEHKKNPRIEDTSWRIPVVGNCGWFATARQRAEAFLRTVGKWKEAAK